MKTTKKLAYLSIAVFSLGAIYPAPSARAVISQQIQVGDFHLAPKSLAYRYKDIFMAANVVGYNYIGGMMLPLSFTADMLGSYVTIDHQRGRAEGWVETPENSFVIDMPKRLLKVDGQERILPQGVAAMVGTEMYVDASFLASILPVNYQVNYDRNIIDLQPQKELRVFQRMDFVNRYFEDIRKRAGLPYRPWTLEEAIAASSEESPLVRQGVVPKGLEKNLQSTSGLTPQTDPIESPMQSAIVPLETIPPAPEAPVFGTPGVSQSAPIGAVDSSGVVPPITESDMDDTDDEEVPFRSQNNIALDTTQASELQAQQNALLNENNLLILAPEIDGVQGDYIEVYQHDGGFYLPLGHLMDILELGIGVNPAALEASGFFITEDNTFYLNGETREAIVAGQRSTFPEGLVLANPFELYVDAQLLSKLLPLDFRLNMSQLVMDIVPREELPLQARLKRGEKWAKIAIWQKNMRRGLKDAPVIKTPYKAATVPFVDVRTGASYSSNTQSAQTRTSVVASGDLGYLNTETFATVNQNENDTVTNLRFKAGRAERDGGLLGPLNAKEAFVGDIQSYPMPLVSSSELGRGVKVSNRELLRPDQFDETDFYGDAQPGWEVELYQNNVLIDFQVVGEDGRYSFTNIPINYGDNTFRIVQYGPQGQKQEEVREFNIDDQMPKPGKIQYAVSANEPTKGLIQLEDRSAFSRQSEGLAVIGMAEYGVHEKLAIGAGYAHVPVGNSRGNAGEYDFLSANMRTSLLGVKTNLDSAYQLDNGGFAFGVSGLARYGQTNLRGEQRFYNDFNSAEDLRSFLRPLTAEEIMSGRTNSQIESRLQTRTDFSANRPFALPGLGNVTGSANFLLETYEEGESDLSISGRVAKNYLGSNYAAGLRYRTVDLQGQEQGEDEFVDGTFSMRHYLDDGLLIRAATRYQVIPNLELTAVNLSLQKQWTEDINTRLEYTESLSGQEARRVTGYLNWDFDKFFLSPRVQFDENFDYLVGLDLQFSLGMDSRTRNWMMTSERLASSGALSARAFLDEDADGVMDEGEEPLEGVTFNGEEYTTDEQGLAFIPRLSANQPRQVSIDKASVSGIGAQPKEERYAVVGRPGVTTELDYPVVPTLEIEGNAFLELDGETLEYPGLPLELVNSDGEVVRELRTEFDGYYYLPDVYPGQYTLRVAAEEQEIKNMIVDEYSIDTTTLRDEGKYEGFVGGYDFVVRLPQEAEADVMVAAVEQQPVNDMDVTSAPETMLPPADTPVAAPSDVVPQIPAVASTPAAPAEPPVPVTKIRSTPLPPEQARRVFVQAGMYCDYENAQRQLDTLKIAGFEATLKGRSYKGQSCYIVHVGPAEDLAAAEMITQQLQDMGLEQPIIVEENAQIYE